jgi:hypothetical protein
MEGIYVFMGIDAIINELKSKFWVQFFNRRAELMELFLGKSIDKFKSYKTSSKETSVLS